MNEALHARARQARNEIVRGALRGTELLELVLSVPFLDRDAFADALLGIDEVPEDAKDLPREAVPYLPCGVEEILAMVREVPITSEADFVDLGSGVGRVAMLVHLLTGARASGIELQEHLVELARARCAELGLRDVTFRAGDVTASELEGSVFFLYAPFSGDMLARALTRIEDVARRKRVVICAVGLELDVPWLRPRKTSSLSLTLYEVRAMQQ
jgi:SAM-dependent methyltransferase